MGENFVNEVATSVAANLTGMVASGETFDLPCGGSVELFRAPDGTMCFDVTYGGSTVDEAFPIPNNTVKALRALQIATRSAQIVANV